MVAYVSQLPRHAMRIKPCVVLYSLVCLNMFVVGGFAIYFDGLACTPPKWACVSQYEYNVAINVSSFADMFHTRR